MTYTHNEKPNSQFDIIQNPPVSNSFNKTILYNKLHVIHFGHFKINDYTSNSLFDISYVT